MNYLKMALPAALAGMMIAGCNTQTKEETEQTATDSAVVQTPAPSTLNSNQSELLQTILGPREEGDGTAVLRGIAFGDPVSKVKKTEQFELFEDSTSHVGFTSETAQLETIDVQYHLDNQKKVSKITVDVYLNSADATKQLWEAGKSYFTEKGKLLKNEPKKVSWTNKNARIMMEDVSEGKDYGLKFQFTPANKTELAAN
ncbi:hypothetical protein HWI92_21925 [Dyadobacter sandarakinus]|uniref:Lipoprotein n=2 Tax=Dyadobacter sandarakinus TaxID=2747268 RepID=A0ABX7IED1_9BACT|nr:hypothetical protein HWI92_21925 [Dyadobacter sandarakinus]